jgi:hypothetical protein
VKKVLIGGGVVAALGILAALGVFGDLDTPDADQQEKTATACLKAAGLEVKSDIPPYTRVGGPSPEYVLDVDVEGVGHDHLAFVSLFDDEGDAELYVDNQKLDAENEPRPGITIEQRGPAAVALYADEPKAPKLRACIDKAGKPPDEQ